jgi:RNA polymerase sigma-70 factor, ECF subfamily
MSGMLQLENQGHSTYAARLPLSIQSRMELDNDTALALLKRVMKKDQQAYATLHRSVAQRVFAFAMSQLKDADRAEEVVVDALHEVWRFPERFNGTSRFSTWVLGIARNKILNVFRAKRDSEVELSEELEDKLVSEYDEGFDDIARFQRTAGVRNCMDKLSDEHRACMHLAFYENMGLADIALVQSVPENTIKTRLFHARQKIKNCLRLLLEGEGQRVSMEQHHA